VMSAWRAIKGEGEGEGAGEKVPWGAILKRRAVWAVVYIHFCQNWGHFCLLAWLPTFYNEGLHLELSQAALVSMVPPILSLAVSAAAAPLADKYVQRGTDVTLVRKVAQGTAFVVPTLCMGLVAYAAELSLPLDGHCAPLGRARFLLLRLRWPLLRAPRHV